MLATWRWKKGISRNWPNVAHTHVCVSRAQYVISWPQSSLEMPGYIQKAPPNSFNKSFLRNTSGSCLFTRVKMQTKLLSHVTNNIQYCICCWWVRARSLSKISRFTLYSRAWGKLGPSWQYWNNNQLFVYMTPSNVISLMHATFKLHLIHNFFHLEFFEHGPAYFYGQLA